MIPLKKNLKWVRLEHNLYNLLNDKSTKKYINISILNKNPWYTKSQVDYAFKGPYRHQLRKREDYLKKVFNKCIKQGQKVIDLGCGDGVYINTLIILNKKIKIYGADYNLLRLKRAWNKFKKVIYFRVDLTKRVFQNNFFDCVFSNHVLEHIKDDEMVLKNVRSMLKNKGYFILGVPQEGAFVWKLRNNFLQRSILRKTDHIHFYTEQELRKKITKAGFEILEVKRMNYGFPITYVDIVIKSFKFLHDLFEFLGEKICPMQAGALYFVCRKK